MLMGKNCSLTASLRDTDGFTPLMRAAYCGRFQVVYHIVKNCPASVMCRDPNGRIFLHYLKVVSNAEMDTINAMIYAFGSILPNLTTEGLRSTQDCDGNTPLHLALKENNFAAAKFLLLCCSKEQVRTELYITNNNGQSVLDLLEALADNNLDVKELKDLVLLGQSKALGIKVMEKEVYEAAVNGNVSLFESHDDGATADDATSEEVGSGCFDVQISGSYDDSRFLSRTPGGSNILHIAFQYGNSFRFCNEAIKRYPELLFDIDCNGDSPVHIAAKFCGGSTIEYIETHYRKFCHEPFVYPWRVKNSKGNTPLHEAVQSISSGASGDLIRVDPESALCVNDAGETPLHLFARRSRDTGFIENVFCYEEGRSSAYIRDKEGLTPLLRAAKSGRLEVVQSILNNCPGSIHVRDLNGRSFLHLLHFHRYKLDGMEMESCEIPGVDFLRSVQDFDGNTPLMSSIKDGNPLAAKYIIQRFTQSSYREMCDHVEVLNNDGQSIFDVLALHDDAPNEVFKVIENKLGTKYLHVRSSHGIGRTQIKEMANTLSLVAALLITLTFAAAFQVPGGYNDNGSPVLLKRAAFQLFVLSNSFAMCGSMAVLFSLLWVMLTGDVADSFVLVDYSISVLLFSFNATLMAFMTGVYVSTTDKSLGLAIFICILCSAAIVLIRKSFVLRLIRLIRAIQSIYRAVISCWKCFNFYF